MFFISHQLANEKYIIIQFSIKEYKTSTFIEDLIIQFHELFVQLF
jgi:hypothetical protein